TTCRTFRRTTSTASAVPPEPRGAAVPRALSLARMHRCSKRSNDSPASPYPRTRLHETTLHSGERRSAPRASRLLVQDRLFTGWPRVPRGPAGRAPLALAVAEMEWDTLERCLGLCRGVRAVSFLDRPRDPAAVQRLATMTRRRRTPPGNGEEVRAPG